MYCSTCGRPQNGNLNYCSGCGARIEKTESFDSTSPQRLFAAATGAVAVVGLIAFIPLVRVLLRSQLEQWPMIAIMGMYLFTVIMLFSILIGHARKQTERVRGKDYRFDGEYVPAPLLNRVDTAQLEPARAMPRSVVDSTTRALDEVAVRR